MQDVVKISLVANEAENQFRHPPTEQKISKELLQGTESSSKRFLLPKECSGTIDLTHTLKLTRGEEIMEPQCHPDRITIGTPDGTEVVTPTLVLNANQVAFDGGSITSKGDENKHIVISKQSRSDCNIVNTSATARSAVEIAGNANTFMAINEEAQNPSSDPGRPSSGLKQLESDCNVANTSATDASAEEIVGNENTFMAINEEAQNPSSDPDRPSSGLKQSQSDCNAALPIIPPRTDQP